MVLQHGLVKVVNGLLYVVVAISALLLLLSITGQLSEDVMPPRLVGLALFSYFGASAVFRLITLPLEWNASFGRGLPMLEQRHLLEGEDLQSARSLLFVAASTYIAVAVLGLLAFLVVVSGR